MLDRKKVERERLHVGQKNVNERKCENLKLQSIGFDGRKDKTITTAGITKEEHIKIVREPSSSYIDHLTPDNGTSCCIANEILHLIFETGSSGSLNALLCDATVVNTGKFGGVIKLIETELDRPMHWLVCQLHLNELQFKHVFELIDGKTSGPGSFKGEIGKKITVDLTNLEVVPFKKINGSFHLIPDNICSELSSDQKYLYSICLSIQSGDVSNEISKNSPGNIHHAQWLTRANRILRLYISTEKPTKELIDLITIIMQCYAPGWFQIKSNYLAINRAQNFWYIAQLVKNAIIDVKYKELMEQVLKQNSYFANPENILLAMISDERKQVRTTAIQRILKSRFTSESNRHFKLSTTLNLGAIDYCELINWDIEEVHSPPLLNDYSNEDILKANDTPLSIPKYPCHSQNMERIVGAVTKASENRYGYEKRHKCVINLLESRGKMPKFDWKAQWK